MGNYKKLYRSRDKKICGVCSGIGEYFELDPTFIRLLWIVLAFLSCFVGVIAYLVFALVIPEAPNNSPNVGPSDGDHVVG